MTLPLPGSIGLVHVSGLIGDLIHLGEVADGSPWSADFEHAFVLASSDEDVDASMIVQATPGGVQEVSLGSYSGRPVLWLVPPDEHTGRGVVYAARTYLGVPYAYADYFAIAAKRLGLHPYRLVEQIEVSRHMICSQLAAACAAKAGWELFPPKMWSGYVTPAMLGGLVPPGTSPQVIP